MDAAYVLLHEKINNENEEPKGDKWTFLKTPFFFVFQQTFFIPIPLPFQRKNFWRKYKQFISICSTFSSFFSGCQNNT